MQMAWLNDNWLIALLVLIILALLALIVWREGGPAR
jgi:hypothetical protein